MGNIDKLNEIIKGIDKEILEDNDGWWETSTGAEFGLQVKMKLINLYNDYTTLDKTADQELSDIDMVLARRPALDGIDSRVGKVLYAIDMARMKDSIEQELIECKKLCDKLKTEREGLIHIWFKKGQESIQRKNPSGCCCKFDEEENIVSICGAHQEYFEDKEVEKKCRR